MLYMLLFVHFVLAQDVYMSVGADGTITFTDSLISPGVNSNKILAIIIINKPSNRLVLYLIRYLFKYFNSLNYINIFR